MKTAMVQCIIAVFRLTDQPTGDRMILDVLTVQQPYATMILRGDKPEEFRSWEPPKRLLEPEAFLLIHAGARFHANADEMFEPLIAKGWSRKRIEDEFPRSAIVGAVRVASFRWDKKRECFAWKLVEPYERETPVPTKGKLGIWKFDLVS